MGLFDSIGEGLDKALAVVKPVTTLYNQITWQYEPRGIVAGTPQAGYPEGRDEINTNNIVDRTADVLTAGKSFYDQVKGLFGLGYPANEAQPVSPIKNELDPRVPVPTTDKPIIDTKILIILGILVFLVLK